MPFPGESVDGERSFDFERERKGCGASMPSLSPAPNPGAFARRGGKMITWWGLADTALNPHAGIDCYDQVGTRMGMILPVLPPGGGPLLWRLRPFSDRPTDSADEVGEQGQAPQQLPAVSEDGKYNRAYCAYPAHTLYKGTGNSEGPSNYECRLARAPTGPR